MDAAQLATQDYILCQIAGTTYGLPSQAVQHLEMVPTITPVPNTLPFVEGIVMVRGQAIPVLNLRLRLGLPWQPHDLRSRLVIIRHHEHSLGLLVDSAREFVRLPTEVLQPPPSAVGEISNTFLAGIATLGERLIVILQIEAILSDVVPPTDATV